MLSFFHDNSYKVELLPTILERLNDGHLLLAGGWVNEHWRCQKIHWGGSLDYLKSHLIKSFGIIFIFQNDKKVLCICKIRQKEQ